MTTAKQQQSWRSWALANPDSVRLLLGYTDGHTIYDARILDDIGLPAELRGGLVSTHHSDGTMKGSIFTESGIAAELTGVYGLTLAGTACRALTGCTHRDAFGRGTGARRHADAVRDWLDANTPAPEES